MRFFVVNWQIELHAADPENAARLAWEILRRPESVADTFDVHEEGKEPVRVDLTEIDQERAFAPA